MEAVSHKLLCRGARCVPGWCTKEALLVLIQGGLLVSRTLLTDYISRVEGNCGKYLTSLVSESICMLALLATTLAARAFQRLPAE